MWEHQLSECHRNGRVHRLEFDFCSLSVFPGKYDQTLKDPEGVGDGVVACLDELSICDVISVIRLLAPRWHGDRDDQGPAGDGILNNERRDETRSGKAQ